MRTGEQLVDGRTGVQVVVLADAHDTGGAYGLLEVALPGGTCRSVGGRPAPLRLELEILHGHLLVDGDPLRAGDQVALAGDALARWTVEAGRGVLLLVEIRPGGHLRAAVQMLLDGD
ncbi:hypothetical protein GKE82_11055 [Conexibacter sp. W3-3-2]|uniref:Quercetin 2,3-dioxygenase C-terminal cupin domain-containing protein n=1 Tax=Paraconexibacter algicola TaxID=2133960 RepID=A0A2T4UH34_9ACTN|nr:MULTISPECIES: hypothetical protein [Solirubrobacterales]MTD44813.1 hypothetical protein [Conexibacter sp. W3-3-2]PTL58553.1 hypothetical protein C7Y72_02210 [Paraconexibacter algicola]